MRRTSHLLIQVSREMRAAAESVLCEGETLASFVQESVHLSIERRKAQSDFLARGLAAREEANQSGRYVSSAEMLARLDASLARARAGRRADEQ